VINLSNFTIAYFPVSRAIVIARSPVGLRQFYKTEGGQLTMDKMFLELPVLAI
jgi:hypothetical protein